MIFTTTTTTSSGPVVRDDTWWDDLLERLRQHRLHPSAEVVVAWIMSTLCLLYYGIGFTVICLETLKNRYGLRREGDAYDFFPLMTSPKGQVETHTAAELVQEIRNQLKDSDLTLPSEDDDDDDRLVQKIRADATLRRLVSRLFQTADVATVIPDLARWKRLWPRLLELPELPQRSHDDVDDVIALILPAHREDGRRLVRTLRIAVERCADPTRVQIIVVHAGHCPDLDAVRDFLTSSPCHADSRIVPYDDGGGGRGPTLDHGTRFVTAPVTICTFLHSDTLLPRRWDASVRNVWFGPRARRRKKVQAAAFLFGQDKSVEGLDGGPFPWGIRSVQILGNVRAWALSLPYGDHVISMPLAYYRHVGGFPHQPIMEDYELMDYCRRRARVRHDETLRIILSMVRTGVRRWQAHGVVYVTLVNALIVARYQRGWTPQDIFDYYYVRPGQNKKVA